VVDGTSKPWFLPNVVIDGVRSEEPRLLEELDGSIARRTWVDTDFHRL
jgi:hypothetical protein